jgi:hypothetical protein
VQRLDEETFGRSFCPNAAAPAHADDAQIDGLHVFHSCEAGDVNFAKQFINNKPTHLRGKHLAKGNHGCPVFYTWQPTLSAAARTAFQVSAEMVENEVGALLQTAPRLS